MSETKNISLHGLRTFLQPLIRLINRKAESWEDLKGKPFGSKIEEVKLVDNVSVTLSADFGDSIPRAEFPVDLVEGQTYYVTYDGVTYECESVSVGRGDIYIGNSELIGDTFLSGNGEPFLIGAGYIAGETLNSTHTLTITTKEEVIKKLDSKYIDINIDTSNLVKSVNGNTPDDYGDVYLGLTDLYGNLPISKGGTGAATVANARGNLGLGYTSGAVPIANGGTGATSATDALTNLGIDTKLDNKMNKSDPKGSGSFGLNYLGTLGTHAVAVGSHTIATGHSAHAEGNVTAANGSWSHAEGHQTTASGGGAHAEGLDTLASGNYSHAEGYGTIAAREYQHAQGMYNISDTTKYAHIVGNGTSANYRSNAHTLDWNGNGWYQGSVCVGGTDGDAPAATLAANGLILTDETTGTKYRVYINNAKLAMEVIS